MRPKIHPCPATDCPYTFTSKEGVREHVKRENEHFIVVQDYMRNPNKYTTACKLLVPTEGRHSERYDKAHSIAWQAYNEPKPSKAGRRKTAAKKHQESHKEETRVKVKLNKLRAKAKNLGLGEKDMEEEAQGRFEEWKNEKSGRN